MTEVVHEVRHTVRSLMKRPMYSLVIVGTLALGFGANTGGLCVTTEPISPSRG